MKEYALWNGDFLAQQINGRRFIVERKTLKVIWAEAESYWKRGQIVAGCRCDEPIKNNHVRWIYLNRKELEEFGVLTVKVKDILDYWINTTECECRKAQPIGGCLSCDLQEIRSTLEEYKNME